MRADPKPYIDAIFGHDPRQGEWYWAEPAPQHMPSLRALEHDAGLTVDVLLKAFREFDSHLAGYAPWQVATGFNFIFNNSLSNLAFALKSPARPATTRAAVVTSLRSVFDRVFEPHCERVLCHLDRSSSELNRICYMFWDVTPILHFGVEEIRRECFSLMKHCLGSSNPAVVESAIHGLGHNALKDPHARDLVDAYIRRPGLREPDLVAYARRARTGMIV